MDLLRRVKTVIGIQGNSSSSKSSTFDGVIRPFQPSDHSLRNFFYGRDCIFGQRCSRKLESKFTKIKMVIDGICAVKLNHAIGRGGI